QKYRRKAAGRSAIQAADTPPNLSPLPPRPLTNRSPPPAAARTKTQSRSHRRAPVPAADSRESPLRPRPVPNSAPKHNLEARYPSLAKNETVTDKESKQKPSHNFVGFMQDG